MVSGHNAFGRSSNDHNKIARAVENRISRMPTWWIMVDLRTKTEKLPNVSLCFLMKCVLLVLVVSLSLSLSLSAGSLWPPLCPSVCLATAPSRLLRPSPNTFGPNPTDVSGYCRGLNIYQYYGSISLL